MAKKDTSQEKKDYIEEGDGHVVITLARAETVAGGKVTTVTMREPEVGDWRRMKKQPGTEEDKEAFMICNLCSLAPSEYDKFSLKNMVRCAEAFSLFIV